MDKEQDFKSVIEAIGAHQKNSDGLFAWLSDHVSLFDQDLIKRMDDFAQTAQQPGQFRVALAVYQSMEYVASIQHDPEQQVSSLVSQGDLLNRLCILDEALDSYEAALKLARENQMDTGQVSLCLANMGSVYQNAQLYQQALPLLEEVAKNDEQSDDFTVLAESIGNLAGLYHNLKEYEKALELHQSALVKLRIPEMFMGELSPATKPLAIELLNTGLTYMELGKHVQALNCFRESLVAFRKVGQRPNMEEYGGTAGFTMALVSSYSQGHMPSPFIRQEVTVLMNIAKCAKLLKRYSESDSARDEAAALVNEYGLQDMVEVVRALYEKE